MLPHKPLVKVSLTSTCNTVIRQPIQDAMTDLDMSNCSARGNDAFIVISYQSRAISGLGFISGAAMVDPYCCFSPMEEEVREPLFRFVRPFPLISRETHPQLTTVRLALCALFAGAHRSKGVGQTGANTPPPLVTMAEGQPARYAKALHQPGICTWSWSSSRTIPIFSAKQLELLGQTHPETLNTGES